MRDFKYSDMGEKLIKVPPAHQSSETERTKGSDEAAP